MRINKRRGQFQAVQAAVARWETQSRVLMMKRSMPAWSLDRESQTWKRMKEILNDRTFDSLWMAPMLVSFAVGAAIGVAVSVWW
jgi:hypothetical protein